MVLEQKTLKKFLQLFTKYQHTSVANEDVARKLFFLKFSGPWEMFIGDYKPGVYTDSVSVRTFYVHMKLT